MSPILASAFWKFGRRALMSKPAVPKPHVRLLVA